MAIEDTKTHRGGIPFLKAWQEEAEGIAGEWNGDLPGLQEERASIANDIIEKCEELLEGHKELQELIDAL